MGKIIIRDTQQTVAVTICSEDLSSSTIFGLMYDDEMEFSLARKTVMPVVFGQI